jgi:hypothetical protein
VRAVRLASVIRDILRFPVFFISWKPVAAGEGDEAVRSVVDHPANSEAREQRMFDKNVGVQPLGLKSGAKLSPEDR